MSERRETITPAEKPRRGCIAETGKEKDKGRRLISKNANRKCDREKGDINIKLKLTKISRFFTFIR